MAAGVSALDRMARAAALRCGASDVLASVMARHKDANWNLADDINDNGNPVGLARRQVALLMDIRDELQTLNRLLGCRNFTGIPATLRAIQRQTKKDDTK